jgi:hypothetical protein
MYHPVAGLALPTDNAAGDPKEHRSMETQGQPYTTQPDVSKFQVHTFDSWARSLVDHAISAASHQKSDGSGLIELDAKITVHPVAQSATDAPHHLGICIHVDGYELCLGGWVTSPNP